MSLLDALGPAATVAQLVGVDAAGLVAATLNAVRTARRNRKECRSLARRVMMVGDLLQLVGSSETLRRPEVRRALDGLGDALRRAFELVESCQERGAAYGFVMAGRQAEQFRDVQSEIDSYLLVFPMVSHIDVTIRLDRIYNMLLPLDHPQQQALEVVPGSSTSHIEPHARNEESVLGFLPLESNVTEASEAEEHHRTAYDLLKAATNNFSSRNQIGSGGWSTVYKAHIGGLHVAIKRYPTEEQEPASQFISEYEILKKLQHKNIIKLLGDCTGEGESFLVYEYMPNGSLDKLIFGSRCRASINWTLRFHIMEGIAQGLLYLHMHQERIVHKDLKPSNILLDSDMNAKISDFGIARMLFPEVYHDTYIAGTCGYMAPEYVQKGILSPKVDVYAYGVILLEMISGKKFRIELEDEYMDLIRLAWNFWATKRPSELIDPSLRHGDQITDISRCVQIALLCVQMDPADRPSISDVLLMLGNKTTISLPKEPDWFFT